MAVLGCFFGSLLGKWFGSVSMGGGCGTEGVVEVEVLGWESDEGGVELLFAAGSRETAGDVSEVPVITRAGGR